MKKIISTLLVAAMLFGAVVGLIPESSVRSYAAEAPSIGYEEATKNALTTSYADISDKLQNDPAMSLNLAVRADNDSIYELWSNPYTGEVVYYNRTTGEGITTNPYDVGGNTQISDSIKAQLLSQVVVSYVASDGSIKTMYSFTEAAERGQIRVKAIQNGIRVQYMIGRENAIYLMPGWITAARFAKEIVEPLEAYIAEMETLYGTSSAQYKNAEFLLTKTMGAYTLQDPNTFDLNTETGKKLCAQMQKSFPITAQKDPATGKFYAIYTVAETLTDVQKATYEGIFRTYCPNYTFEDMEADNALTGYVSKTETPALFKLSIEYSINKEDGSLDVRLPSNSILYDETLFRLENISTLQFLGAGRMSTITYDSYFGETGTIGAYGGTNGDAILYDGYIFYPDGSGALFEFGDLYTNTNKASVAWEGKVYGQDYAYYTVSGENQEAIRLPAYGIVSTKSVTKQPIMVDNGQGTLVQKTDAVGKPLYNLVTEKQGFLAILEEGEAMTSLAISFGATRHNYASVYPVYVPRPNDTYDLSDSVSVSGNTKWTVVADRKYTGNYRTRIVMLSDLGNDSYPTTWVGMATAYRDYLVNKGTLNRLTAEAVEDQIPLYLEVFGSYETTKQILSVPVDVKVPLTSFADVSAIYNDLAENAGITNVNFKLTGFANGGMAATYPAKLKWEKSVGGSRGFEELVAEAKEKNFGVYPDFDFTYISNEARFDGVSLKELGARTVDNRYCSKQVYDAVHQEFISYFDMCVATNLIAEYYGKFSKKLSSYSGEDTSFGLSVGTLGSDLNSSFDEDNPINREEAKEDIVNLLTSMKDSYKSLMTSGGNGYVFGYSDHIIGLPLASSNYRYASASVPFMAMVLHGYVNYTGAAINMKGDTQENLLRSIENGAYPYFLLSYNTANTMLLKKDEVLSQYYSIRYDIWRWADDAKTQDGTLIEQYNILNRELADLQTAVIEDHRFIRGERVLKADEIAATKLELEAEVLSALRTQLALRTTDLLDTLADSLVLYARVEEMDSGILAVKATETRKGDQRRVIRTFLEANGFADAAERDLVAAAYVDGNGLSDLRVLRGLRVVLSADADAVWASIVSAVKPMNYTEAELGALREKVNAILAEATQNNTANILASLSAIIAAPTAEDLALFNRLIYSGVDAAHIEGELDGFSVTLDAAAKTAMSELILATRAAGKVLAVCDSVAVDFDYNMTDSSATDSDYADTDYTLQDERLVLVTYRKADGTRVRFILNYNIFSVEVKLDGVTYELDSYDWERIGAYPNGGEG